jgi:ATP-dependent DNA ligase
VRPKRLTPRPWVTHHQPEGRGSFNKIERASLAADTAGMATMIKRLPTGFVVPAQPVKASKPPVGTDWVHEIKHDGYRIIVRRDGPTVRLYSRNAYDWTDTASIAT